MRLTQQDAHMGQDQKLPGLIIRPADDPNRAADGFQVRQQMAPNEATSSQDEYGFVHACFLAQKLCMLTMQECSCRVTVIR